MSPRCFIVSALAFICGFVAGIVCLISLGEWKGHDGYRYQIIRVPGQPNPWQ